MIPTNSIEGTWKCLPIDRFSDAHNNQGPTINRTDVKDVKGVSSFSNQSATGREGISKISEKTNFTHVTLTTPVQQISRTFLPISKESEYLFARKWFLETNDNARRANKTIPGPAHHFEG